MSILYMLSSRFTRTRSRFSLVDICVRRGGYGNFSRKPSHAAKMYEACRPTWQKLFVTRNSGWNPCERDDREWRSWISWRAFWLTSSSWARYLFSKSEPWKSNHEVTNMISEPQTWFARVIKSHKCFTNYNCYYFPLFYSFPFHIFSDCIFLFLIL